MTDTTAEHIAARDDKDLINRLVAAAEQAHIPNPERFVWDNRGVIISTDIGSGATITSVHAYAASVYAAALAALPLKPGFNPAAVTDPQLAQAIQAVWVASTTPTP